VCYLLIFDELSNSQGKETSVDMHGILEILKEKVTHSDIGSLYAIQEREKKRSLMKRPPYLDALNGRPKNQDHVLLIEYTVHIEETRMGYEDCMD